MARVIEAKRIRDRMPRWLWELKVECGHFHYELVEKHPQAPVDVLCRACQAEARVAKYRARVASLAARGGQPVGAGYVLSESSTERVAVAEVPFELDGGLDMRERETAPSVAVPASSPRKAHPLPACMQPRPGAPVPRPRALPSGPVPEGTGQVQAAPKKKRRGPDPNQGTLFDL